MHRCESARVKNRFENEALHHAVEMPEEFGLEPARGVAKDANSLEADHTALPMSHRVWLVH